MLNKTLADHPVVIQADPKLLVKGNQANFQIMEDQIKNQIKRNKKKYETAEEFTKAMNMNDCRRVTRNEFLEFVTKRELKNL